MLVSLITLLACRAELPTESTEDTGTPPVTDTGDGFHYDDPVDTGDSAETVDTSDTAVEDTGGYGRTTSERRRYDLDGDTYGDPEHYEFVNVCDEWQPGFVNWIEGRNDCNDSDATIHPDAVEVCDSVDNNCDGNIDEGVLTKFYADVDGDLCAEALTTGNFTIVSLGCGEAPAGTIIGEAMTCDMLVGDCDDSNASIYAGATETCNSLDDDCDGTIDDECVVVE